MNSFADMAAPFLREVPIEQGSIIIRQAFRREHVLRDHEKSVYLHFTSVVNISFEFVFM